MCENSADSIVWRWKNYDSASFWCWNYYNDNFWHVMLNVLYSAQAMGNLLIASSMCGKAVIDVFNAWKAVNWVFTNA